MAEAVSAPPKLVSWFVLSFSLAVGRMDLRQTCEDFVGVTKTGVFKSEDSKPSFGTFD